MNKWLSEVSDLIDASGNYHLYLFLFGFEHFVILLQLLLTWIVPSNTSWLLAERKRKVAGTDALKDKNNDACSLKTSSSLSGFTKRKVPQIANSFEAHQKYSNKRISMEILELMLSKE